MRHVRVLLFASVLFVGFSCDGLTERESCSYRQIGTVRQSCLHELSGIAPVNSARKFFWALNDDDNPNSLFVIDSTGKRCDRDSVTGVPDRDWEDLAAVRINDTPYLVISETGDNFACHKNSFLYFVTESPCDSNGRFDAHLKCTRKITFRYEDGPHDVEALAIVPSADTALLFSKRLFPPVAYEMDLRNTDTSVQIAHRLCIPAGIHPELPLDSWGYWPLQILADNWITGAAMSSDGTMLALLTYRRIYLYKRESGEPWRDALQRNPQRLGFGKLSQAEAICFTKGNSSLIVSGENTPTPLMEISLAK